MGQETILEAARELWDENPELRGSYNHDFQGFLNTYALLKEWENNPQLRQEFMGEFNLFVTYKRYEAAGNIR